MARIQRARTVHQRYEQCLQVLLLCVLCGVAGEDDLSLVLAAVCMLKLKHLADLAKPTQWDGIQHVFFEVMGGFDFKETFRFEKPHFLELLDELDLPQYIEISR